MVKVGIIGATGYAGAELVRILLNHKEAQIEWFGSRSYIDENYADIYRNFFELVDADCLGDNMDELASRVDVIFTATPQGFLAGVLNEDILNKVKIIDLSADFRINNQCIRINQSLFYQRICCQNGTGRITSRICNQTGLGGHLITVNLTESVNGFLNKLWAFMLNLIPFFIGSNIFDSKIRDVIRPVPF